MAIHAALVALLVPVHELTAPVANWREPLVLALLAAMAVVVDRHDVPLPAGIRFDALMAVALIAVAVGGPLPAFAVVLVPMVFNAATGHERLLRAGNLANLAAYGWYTLATPTTACNYPTWASLAKTAAAVNGFNAANYDHVIYLFPAQSSCGWAGLAYMPGKDSWVNGELSVRVTAHELGHNLGLNHAGSWDCTNGKPPI